MVGNFVTPEGGSIKRFKLYYIMLSLNIIFYSCFIFILVFTMIEGHDENRCLRSTVDVDHSKRSINTFNKSLCQKYVKNSKF